MNHTQKVLLGIIAVVAIALLARYVVFRERFEKWGEGVERIEAWQTQYKKDHPGATKAEMDAAFDAGIAKITVWKEQYKREHPGASDAEADAAFNAMWKQ